MESGVPSANRQTSFTGKIEMGKDNQLPQLGGEGVICEMCGKIIDDEVLDDIQNLLNPDYGMLCEDCLRRTLSIQSDGEIQ